MRELGVSNGESGESGLSTVMPVLFGESGDATICVGKDWRFNEYGVRDASMSVAFGKSAGVRDESSLRPEEVTCSGERRPDGSGCIS